MFYTMWIIHGRVVESGTLSPDLKHQKKSYSDPWNILGSSSFYVLFDGRIHRDSKGDWEVRYLFLSIFTAEIISDIYTNSK
jgi:hypothetical protein